jgi:uncharacterized protein
MSVQPIAANLFEETPNGVYLCAGRSRTDGRLVFPMPPGDSGTGFERVRLGRIGQLWSWTVQRFRPKSPPYAGVDDLATFKPFAVGYIELPGELIVESRLIVDDFSVLQLGLPMELVLEPFSRTAQGELRATYAFKPLQRGVGTR